jgi:hypothetical protein
VLACCQHSVLTIPLGAFFFLAIEAHNKLCKSTTALGAFFFLAIEAHNKLCKSTTALGALLLFHIFYCIVILINYNADKFLWKFVHFTLKLRVLVQKEKAAQGLQNRAGLILGKRKEE